MTARRRVIEGSVYASSRRTTRRHLLFVPDLGGEAEQAFWYCLALAAREYGIDVHVAVLMSNHLHLVFTDTRGQQSNFYKRFHRLFALCTQRRLKWPEEVFNKEKTSAPELVSTEAILNSMAYAIANPVIAGLVRRASDWPGARTSVKDLGSRVVRVERPKHYLRSESWPDVLELELTLPASLLAEMKPDEIRRRVHERVRAHEREALTQSKESGRRFMGARRVQRVHHAERANSYEQFGARNPRFAAGGDRDAARAAVATLRAFDRDYDAALARWCAGDRRAVFPVGTWWMRVHHGARVRPPP